MSKELKSSRPKRISSHKGLLISLLVAMGVLCFWYGFKEKTTLSKEVVIDKGEIIATVDDHPVYLSEVRSMASSIPQLAGVPFETVYPKLLEGYLDSKVILKAAEKSNIVNDKEVQKALKMAKEQVLTQAYLTKKLQEMMTPDKLKEIYDAELAQYVPPEEIRASHILLSSEKDAKDVLIQLKAGANFATLADEKSLDKEHAGGDLGYFTKEMMIPEFSKLFDLSAGKLSEPIKTPFGWHVVLVQDKRLKAPPKIEQVQEALQQRFMEENVPAVVAQERAKQKVVVLKPALTPVVAEEVKEEITQE